MTPAHRWHETRSFHHSAFPAERIRAERTETISVCVPALNEAATVEPIVSALAELREQGVIDQLVVLDGGSTDGTAELAAAAGAEVHSDAGLVPEMGPTLGKGDAMWRSLAVLTGDLVCFLDADSEHFGPHFACGLLGPLVCEPGTEFVKAYYRRPFKVGEVSMPEGGGRVTELTARPLLNLFYPELAGVRQPLAGELAARRELLERVPFATGYAVEIALLIDVYKEAGLAAMAQVDLDVRQNAHQSLADLGPMAYAVLRAVATRLEREGRLTGVDVADFLAPGPDGLAPRAFELVERPPYATLRAAL